MTTRREGPTTWRRAALSQVEDIVRAGLVGLPRRHRTRRDEVFHRYLRVVRRTLREEPADFEVVASRPLATGATSAIIELTLHGDTPVAPGDMLYAWWLNHPDRVGTALGEAPTAHWTTPVPHRPSRRQRVPASDLHAAVLDLSDPDTLPTVADAPRIMPRFFTVSHAVPADDGWRVSLQVTLDGSWPARAASYLHRVAPGERVRAWVLPHPHRVDRAVPGVAVATGSGAAGVFAALRAGATGIRFVWGLGDKQLAPWVDDEMRGFVADGSLAELHLARSPQRVTDLLPDLADPARAAIADDGWVYVSGNEAMGHAVDAQLVEICGADALAAAAGDLRYIVST